MIRLIDGDLFSKEHQFIAHGVNCKGKMGSGFALSVKEKFPNSFKSYEKLCRRDGSDNLGTCLITHEKNPSGSDCHLIHLFSQNEYSRQYKTFDIEAYIMAFSQSIYDIVGMLWIDQQDEFTIAMPRIGTGLAKGDWDQVYNATKSIIEAIEAPIIVNIDFYKYEG